MGYNYKLNSVNNGDSRIISSQRIQYLIREAIRIQTMPFILRMTYLLATNRKSTYHEK